MNDYTKGKKLKIFISNTDKFKHEPLYEVIIFAAKRYKMAGATAVKCTMGYGSSSSNITNTRFWEITEKIPVVVEVIDLPDKIEMFIDKIMPYFDKIKNGCLVTTEDIDIVIQKSGITKKKRFEF